MVLEIWHKAVSMLQGNCGHYKTSFSCCGFDATQNLIQSRPIVGEVHHLERREDAQTMRAKYLWLNVFSPTKTFSLPVYYIPHSAPRTDNWKQPEIYLWILSVQEFTYLSWSKGFKVIPRYRRHNLPKDALKIHKHNLNFGQFLD